MSKVAKSAILDSDWLSLDCRSSMLARWLSSILAIDLCSSFSSRCLHSASVACILCNYSHIKQQQSSERQVVSGREQDLTTRTVL